MATGTTQNFELKRNEVIELAYNDIGVVGPGRALTAVQLQEGIKRLNLIIREEDARGMRQNKNLWALDEKTLKLQANGFVYDVANDGLASGVVELVTAFYRDTNGDDIELKLIQAEQYEAISDKDDTGDPESIYLKRNKDLTCQFMYVWPAPSSVGTTSEVIGSDGVNYRCIMGHTSATINKPITGTSYRLYWEPGGTSGSAWVTATDYTNGELIRYVIKRPLYDFDNATDNPDMPQGWGRYLMKRLAYDLSPSYHLALDERQLLRAEYMDARSEIFPQSQPDGTQIHNKYQYY